MPKNTWFRYIRIWNMSPTIASCRCCGSASRWFGSESDLSVWDSDPTFYINADPDPAKWCKTATTGIQTLRGSIFWAFASPRLFMAPFQTFIASEFYLWCGSGIRLFTLLCCGSGFGFLKWCESESASLHLTLLQFAVLGIRAWF
jgi:hypothetical protein